MPPIIHEKAGPGDAEAALPDEHTPGGAWSAQEENEHVMVRLLVVGENSQGTMPLHLKSEKATYTARHRLFHLLRLKEIPVRGQKLLLQVLRQWRHGTQPQESQARSQITDELLFTLEYKQATTGTIPSVELVPGLNQIVIIAGTEETPLSYSIDGAES